jgi:hypothetical protein
MRRGCRPVSSKDHALQAILKAMNSALEKRRLIVDSWLLGVMRHGGKCSFFGAKCKVTHFGHVDDL